jgi:4-amino-4-deoxy-L-arabinose transferase-like glycosyltransferase
MRIAVFIFALVVRIAAIEVVGAQDVTFGDGPDYLDTAQVLCTEHTYPERGNLPFFRAPGLPFFIAGVTLCSPGWTRAIKYGLAVCDSISVQLIFLIAERLGTRRWIAALLASLHPFFVMAVTDIRSEPLFMMFLVAAIWLLFRDRPALTGVALGLAALTRPTGLLCIPLFALFFRRRFVVVIATALLTLAPWTIRNYLRFGELIVVNDAAGFNLWRGTHPELMKVVETHDTKEFRERSWRFESQTVAETARLVDARAKTPGARDREWRRLALENVRGDPAYAAIKTLKKIGMYWRPWLHPAEHGSKAIALSLAVNLGLFILGAIGLARHRDRRLVCAVLIFIGAMWLAHLPYIPTIRLRVPLTDPLLIAFAAGAFPVRRE